MAEHAHAADREHPAMTTTPVMRQADIYLTARFQRREIVQGTYQRYRTVLRTFGQVAGERPVDRLSRREVERWLAERGHLAPGTRRTEYSALRGFCAWLATEGKVRRDPTLGVAAPKVPRPLPRALGENDVSALLGSVPDARAAAIVELMVGMALRRAEVATLEVGDWSRAGDGPGDLYIVGKGGHRRMVPVTEQVAGALTRYLAEHPAAAGPLVRNYHQPRALRPDTIGKLVGTWMRAAGVKRAARDGRSAHALRHTAASRVVDVEPDLRVVQHVLGHQSLSSTQIYLKRANLQRVRAALEAAGHPDLPPAA